MSRWDLDRSIHGEVSPTTGEVMVSASDVVAWLRHLAETTRPWHHRKAIDAIADRFAGNWIEAAVEPILNED